MYNSRRKVLLEIYSTDYKYNKNTAVALGYFDGIHIGHRFLIKQMEDYAEKHSLSKAVFTFTKNVKLGHKGKDIYSTEQKVRIMENIGIELFYSPDFIAFAGFTPEEFVDDILIGSMGAKALFCGENFCFGKNRSGNVTVLKELCNARGVEVFIVPTVEMDGVTVSSTEIRNALSEGDMEKAEKMLGRYYSIDFEVVHGKKLGRQMGTPTINQIYPDSMCTPKEGVYITQAVVNGVTYPAATGFGSRPTVGGNYPNCETFILGFSGDIYQKKVEVRFCKYLFPTHKFDNIDQLRKMIVDVSEKSQKFFAENHI